MRVVFISDTHSYHRKVNMPEADVLVHSGDITWRGELPIIEDFSNWLKTLPIKHKIIVFGNHEIGIEAGYKREPALDMITDAGAIYLEDSGTEINGIKFWGSPITPWFYDWEWNRERGEDISVHWNKIPDDTHVLITHGPPYGIADKTQQETNVGCEDLLRRIKQLKDLKIHAFGHIHEGYGITVQNGISFVNASTCNRKYEPIHEPIVLEI